MLKGDRLRHSKWFGGLVLGLCSVGFGASAGGLTMGIMRNLDKVWPVAPAMYFFAGVGLSSFAAGLASGWFRRWSNQGKEGLYACAVAAAWFVLLSGLGWNAGGTHLMVSAWPLLLLDLLLIALAGIAGQRMSKHGSDCMPR